MKDTLRGVTHLSCNFLKLCLESVIINNCKRTLKGTKRVRKVEIDVSSSFKFMAT